MVCLMTTRGPCAAGVGFTHYASGELAQPHPFRVLWDNTHLYLGALRSPDGAGECSTAHDEHAISAVRRSSPVDPITITIVTIACLQRRRESYDGERMNTTWNSEAQVAASRVRSLVGGGRGAGRRCDRARSRGMSSASSRATGVGEHTQARAC